MNIALFSDTYPPEINGVATSTFNLATTLKAHGHSVLVVSTNNSDRETIYSDGVIRIPGKRLKALYDYRASFFYNRKAMKIIENFHPDVVHCQTDMGIGIFGSLVAAKYHIGIVYTFHTMIEDYAYYVTKGHFDRFARHAVRFFYRSKSNMFTEFIAPSEKIKDYLRSIHIDTTVTVIPTGIELDRFSPNNEDKKKTKELKEKYGISPDDYVILSLGRIAKEKSIDVLLKGYASFLSSSPKKSTKFVITGLGPAVDELKELSVSLGIDDHVIFTGPCKPNETQYFYHLADCFASASLTETQGLTFMEAMAANLIVLARYDDNLAGTIIDGESGYFFYSEADFAKRLQFVLNMSSSQKKAIISGGSKIVDAYSMERFYENIIEVYKRVYKKKW